MWLYISIGFLGWSAVWLWLAIRAANPQPPLAPETLTRKLANLLPPFAIIPCLLLVLLLPLPVSPPSVVVRAFHYLGIVLLFQFLLFGAFCQVAVWIKMRRHQPLESLARAYRSWWIATRLLPAPAAICILLSGLRLAYESPLGDISIGFMFWLVAGFSFFFFDGLMYYLPEVCYQHKAVYRALARNDTTEAFCKNHRKPRNEAMLIFHSLSFPLVLAVALAKPANLWVPSTLVRWLQHLFFGCSPNCARLGEASALVVAVGAILLVLRLRQLVAHLRFLYGRPE